MSHRDSVSRTLLVALSLCVVCSVVVTAAAVLLKPAQQNNIQRDRMRNILSAAGMLREGVDVAQQFAAVTAKVVDLRTGRYAAAVTAEGYDPLAAARDPRRSARLEAATDRAKIGRREHYGLVYLVGAERAPQRIILPIRGAGLWGQLYGFLALESDANTVAGIGFYQHRETPGLGGEVDNPDWQRQWPGKQVYRDAAVQLRLIKGGARRGPDFNYQVDGLSGATLTSRGVNNLLQFWLGANGYGPFLARLRAGQT